MIIRNTIKKIFMSQTNFSGSTFSTFEAKKEVQVLLFLAPAVQCVPN